MIILDAVVWGAVELFSFYTDKCFSSFIHIYINEWKNTTPYKTKYNSTAPRITDSKITINLNQDICKTGSRKSRIYYRAVVLDCITFS